MARRFSPAFRRVLSIGLALGLCGLFACIRGRAAVATQPLVIPVAQGSDGYSYFPTGVTPDGHFLALAGAGNVTISGTSLDIKLASPGVDARMQVGLFDGDQGGTWDSGTGTNTIYELYANPNNGTLTDPGGRLNPGVVLLNSWNSSQMADNAWTTLADSGQVTSSAVAAQTNSPLALSASGNYYYVLHVYLVNPASSVINHFRIRTRTPMAVSPSNYGVEAPWSNLAAEEKTYYPNWDLTKSPAAQPAANLTPTTYDGNWTVYFDVPTPSTNVGLWDGDFDHGSQNSYIDLNGNRVTLNGGPGDWDTRDADTIGYLNSTLSPSYNGPADYVARDIPNPGWSNWWTTMQGTAVPAATCGLYCNNTTLRVPGFAATTPGVLEEGVGIGTVQKVAGVLAGYHTGNPVDDNTLNPHFVRLPSNGLTANNYALTDPYGNSYLNGNPSGNSEWERFSVTSDPNATWRTADYGPGWGTPGAQGNDASQNGAQVVALSTPGITPGAGGLPAGVWKLTLSGVDLHNLNAIHPDFDTLGMSLDGKPIAPIRPYTLAGFLTDNCTQAPLSGVTVNLLDGDGIVVITTRTLADGRYLFWVNPGTYTVVVDPSNFAVGGALYHYGTTASGTSAQVAIAGANGRRDFAFQPPAQFTSGQTAVTVSTDANRCTASAASLPAPGTNCSVVSVVNNAPAALPVGKTQVVWTATDAVGNVATFVQQVTVTDTEKPAITAPANVTVSTDAGLSTASNVNLGTPVTSDNCGVAGVTNNAPATFPVGTTTVTWTVSDTSGNTMTATQTVTVNVAVVATAALGDTVWFDANANGVQDAGEPGVANVPVQLYAGDGKLVGSTTTNGDGKYAFGKLLAGSYYVTFQAPSGYTFTKQGQGSDSSKNSHADASGKTETVSLAAGQTNAALDAGLVNSGLTAYTTYTQGGWGAAPSGNNPGAVLLANFSRAYPSGTVVIGGKNALTFDAPTAVQRFLPQGGTPAVLPSSAVDPTATYSVLAGQVLALQLNVDFSRCGVTRPGLGSQTILTGPFAGKSVSQFLAVANDALGGASTGYSLSDINSTADAINNNYDNGTQNLGYLK